MPIAPTGWRGASSSRMCRSITAPAADSGVALDEPNPVGDDQRGEVLDHISFEAKPGQRVALLGVTGAGKSTLVNLITRFYDVTGGRILVDGVDVRDWDPDALRSQIGMVMQQTMLFSGTVRENIAYGKPDATLDEVIAAAKAAQAHDFIMAMPDGYDSIVEARGANLSGGQKQRIAIARALLISPGILILDDSTSAVDLETEIMIQDALDLMACRYHLLHHRPAHQQRAQRRPDRDSGRRHDRRQRHAPRTAANQSRSTRTSTIPVWRGADELLPGVQQGAELDRSNSIMSNNHPRAVRLGYGGGMSLTGESASDIAHDHPAPVRLPETLLATADRRRAAGTGRDAAAASPDRS